MRIEVDHQVSANAMRTRIELGQVGPIGLLSVQSTGATVRRTARLANDDSEPALFLGMQLIGRSMVVQHGRQDVLNPGSSRSTTPARRTR